MKQEYQHLDVIDDHLVGDGEGDDDHDCDDYGDWGGHDGVLVEDQVMVREQLDVADEVECKN